MEKHIYDIVIIGAGPAGLAAGSYAGRARMDVLIIEKSQVGGQISITAEIENYPGSIEGETGPSLVERMQKQSEDFGAKRISDTVVEVELEGEVKVVKGLADEYLGKTVIIATGAFPRPIGCPGEAEHVGKGVSYCATCDAAFFKDLQVYVVGGGDSAVEEALYLSRFGRKVTVIHRRDKLRAAKSIQEKAFANPKIDFMWNTTVEEIKGSPLVSEMVVKNTLTGELTTVEADEDDGIFGIFVFTGFEPNTDLFVGKVEMNGAYIVTDDNMKTNVKGVYAAGDLRVKSLRQVVTAVADGAIAATQAERFVEGLDD